MSRLTIASAVAGLACLGIAPLAGAVPLPVPNFSFELPAQTDGSQSNNDIPGWTFFANFNPPPGTIGANSYGVINPLGVGTPPPTDLVQYAYLDQAQLTGGGGTGGPYIMPTLPTAISTEPGQTFTLTVDVAAEDVSQNIGLFFLVDGVFSNNAFSSPAANSVAANVFATRTLSQMSSTNGQLITFALYSGTAGGSARVYFDNVRFDGPLGTAAPEPSTLTMLALGGMMMLRRRQTRA